MTKLYIVPKEIKEYVVKQATKKNEFSKRFLTQNDFYDLIFDALDYNQVQELDYPLNRAKDLIRVSLFVNKEVKDDELLSQLYNLGNNKFINIDKEIVLVGINDKFIENNFKTTKIDIKDFIKEPTKLTWFKNKEDELRHVFNQIGELIEKGINPSEINIIVCNKTYQPVINYLSLVDNIELTTNSKKMLYDTSEFSEFVKNYTTFNDSIQKVEDEIVKEAIIDIRNKYFKLNDDMLLEVLKVEAKNKSVSQDKIINTINVCSINNFSVNNYNFVVGVNNKSFPNLNDNFVLDDQRCNILNINNSVDRINNQEKVEKLLLTIPNTYFSGEVIKTKDGDVDKSLEERFNFNIEENLETIVSRYKNDIKVNKKKKIKGYNYNTSEFEIKDYKYQVENEVIKVDIPNQVKLSYSSLEDYGECPYKYFLSRVLWLKQEQKDFTKRGNIIHYILEQCFKEGELVDRIKLEEYAQGYFKYDKKGSEFSDEFEKELSLKTVRHYYYFLEEFVRIMLSEKYPLDKNTYYPEEELSIQGDNYKFSGKIDLAIKQDNDSFSVIDFKNKKEVEVTDRYFNDKLKLQNLWYLYLIRNNLDKFDVDNEFEFETTSQIGIHFPYISSKAFDDIKVNEISIIEKKSGDDANFCEQKLAPTKVGRTTLSDDEILSIKNRVKEEVISNKLDNYLEEVSKDIKNGKFKIDPIYEKNNLDACKYCKFKDICHVPNNVKRSVKEKDAGSEASNN